MLQIRLSYSASPLFGLWPRRASAVELAFLGLAGLQGRPATLKLGSGGLCSASQAADLATRREKTQLHMIKFPFLTFAA